MTSQFPATEIFHLIMSRKVGGSAQNFGSAFWPHLQDIWGCGDLKPCKPDLVRETWHVYPQVFCLCQHSVVLYFTFSTGKNFFEEGIRFVNL